MTVENSVVCQQHQAEVYCPKTVENSLSHLRDVTTNIPTFKKHADHIAYALGVKLTDDLPTITKEISTPLKSIRTNFTYCNDVLLVAVLRSGYPMCRGIAESMPGSVLALVDIKRDEETAKPNLNYDGLPDSLDQFNTVIVPDPMLATGGSASMVIEMLKTRGAKNINLVSLISAPEGINRINQEWPSVRITTCAVDEGLNEKSYIVPGLGDFGDRYFGDEPFVIRDELNHQALAYRNNRFMISSL